jgi:hypothetical protein
MVSEFLSGMTGTYPLSLTQWAYQSSTNQLIEEVNYQFARQISDVASTRGNQPLRFYSRRCRPPKSSLI